MACLLLAQTAIAGEFNPFLGPESKGTTIPRGESKARTVRDIGSIIPPLPPMASSSNMPRGILSPDNQRAADDSRPDQPVRVVGRIGNQVTVLSSTGERSIIPNGSMKMGCFIHFPEAICDKSEIFEAKKRFAAESHAPQELRHQVKVNVKEPSPAAIAKKQADQAKVDRAKQQAIEAEKARAEKIKAEREKAEKTKAEEARKKAAAEVEAKLKAAATLASTERALAEKAKAEAKNTHKELEAANKRALKLQAEESARAEKAKLEAEAARKELENVRQKALKLETELASIKKTTATPPEWVRGPGKQYKDAALGEVVVSKTADQVYFQVTNGNEPTADKFFGKNVLKKERRGDYVYYALHAKNVKIRE